MAVNLPKVKKKDVLTAYLAWLLLGLVGTHRFYVKRHSGWSMLLLFLVWLFAPLPFDTFAAGALAVWWMIDAFLIPSMVEHYNIYDYPGSPYRLASQLPQPTKNQYLR